MPSVRIPEDLWDTSMAPEGVLEAWLAVPGAAVAKGQPLAEIRVEDCLHRIQSPCDGRLAPLALANAIIQPGEVIGVVSRPS
jgi:pyruvate/2-oxoglutarate dehydrogenase complex dihydrolipoamide acyltransferase (E2) component